MAGSTQNVVRYSALLTGLVYGFFHARTVQANYDEQSTERAHERRSKLIEEARKAYAEQKNKPKSSGLITDPENPKFDLEKVIESWAEKA